MKPALLLVAFLATLTIAATFARSDLTAVHREKQALPCLGSCVPESDYRAMKRLAAKRLRGWNRANRRIVGLRGALRGQVRLGASGLERGFLCIHLNPSSGHGEGPWDANTGNGYFGGLQMDRAFMRRYGALFLARFGPANNWTPSMQLAVAETAYLSGRGFGPWPNTARACGLL